MSGNDASGDAVGSDSNEIWLYLVVGMCPTHLNGSHASHCVARVTIHSLVASQRTAVVNVQNVDMAKE
jgi:hypothetical protein